MQTRINASVGMHGKNHVDDVVKVQSLLAQQGMPVGRTDGHCGPRTVAAIYTFQAGFLQRPDGLVEPAGKTMARLNMIPFRPAKANHVAPRMASAEQIGTLAPAEAGTSLTRLLPRSKLGQLNAGLRAVSNALMIQKLGKPRESFTADCQPVTNVKLKKHTKTASVGPFKVTGLAPAVDSLATVMADIAKKQPQVYSVLGSAGMLCCRLVKGSPSAISNHSWGTAIDLTLSKVLDKRGDGMVQYGLTVIAPIFNEHGWYWGAAFPIEDAMHFEVGSALLESFLPKLA